MSSIELRALLTGVMVFIAQLERNKNCQLYSVRLPHGRRPECLCLLVDRRPQLGGNG